MGTKACLQQSAGRVARSDMVAVGIIVKKGSLGAEWIAAVVNEALYSIEPIGFALD